jgi:hypothetical protein
MPHDEITELKRKIAALEARQQPVAQAPRPGGVPALKRFGAFVVIAAIVLIALVNSDFGKGTKTPKLDGLSVAERQAKQAQRDAALDYIAKTSRTPGEAYRRTISEGFWTGFAEGLSGK